LKIYLCLLLIFTCLINPANAKDRPEWKYGLSGQLLGPMVFGVYGEHQIKPKTNLVLGIGANFNFQAGITYTLVDEKPRIYWYPYIGAQIVSIKTGNSSSSLRESRALGAIFPLGLKFITKTNLFFAFELAYNYVPSDSDQVNTRPWLPAIRIGKYF
jgi:hypothetical protein